MIEPSGRTRKVDTASMYLDLMKNALSYSLWPDPGMPVSFTSKKPMRKPIFSLLSFLLNRADLQLVRRREQEKEFIGQGYYWNPHADTMIGMKRLSNIQLCVEKILEENISGDLIETGVWRGGSCIFMRAILAANGVEDRKVFVADSFAGLPKPDGERYPEDIKSYPFHELDFLAVSLEEVKNNFQKYGLLDDQVVFLKGWFKETLPEAPMESLSLMRLDGDLYQSTTEALVNLYPKLSLGGFCIIDDYSIEPCRKAVDNYRTRMGIKSPIQRIDWTGVYWRKEQEAD